MGNDRKIAYLSLGSNLTNRLENIKKAIEFLKTKRIKIVKESLFYETEPLEYKVKFKNKERKLTTKKWFLNKVIKIKTKLTPKDLLEICRKIEKELGRKKTIKWGPRTIDLDILFYGNKIIREKDLIIPHSRAHKRRFVLVPLAEISPGFVHPLLRKKVKTLLESLQDSLKVYKV